MPRVRTAYRQPVPLQPDPANVLGTLSSEPCLSRGSSQLPRLPVLPVSEPLLPVQPGAVRSSLPRLPWTLTPRKSLNTSLRYCEEETSIQDILHKRHSVITRSPRGVREEETSVHSVITWRPSDQCVAIPCGHTNTRVHNTVKECGYTTPSKNTVYTTPSKNTYCRPRSSSTSAALGDLRHRDHDNLFQ